MNPDVKEILQLFKHHYIHYNASKWRNVKTIEQFKNKYKGEHGHYYPEKETRAYEKVTKGKHREKGKRHYPRIKYVTIDGKRTKALHIPGIHWNDKATQRRYIKTANDLIMKQFKDAKTITIDLNNNLGGKATFMAAALSPIFNLSKRKRLTFTKLRKGSRPDLVRLSPGCYKTISNPKSCGTTKKLSKLRNINVIMGETWSAGELIAVAFKSLKKQFNVKFYGYRTGGDTTNVIYVKLRSGAAIEFPIGYMMDADKRIYKKGVPI